MNCAVFHTQKSKKEKLLQEKTELEQNLEDVRQSFSGLCKSVSIEPDSEQDHLQLLAKLTSPDFPISCPDLMDNDEESQITIRMVSCSSEPDPRGPAVETIQTATPQASTQTEEAESCLVSSSLLNACLEMNNTL